MNDNIRKATIHNIEALLSLRISLLKEVNELRSAEEEQSFRLATETYLQAALQTELFIAYIATIDDVVISMSGITFFERPPYIGNLEGKEAYILNMYTLPEHRGKGLAKQLLEYCIEECKERQVKRIWLHASEDGELLYQKKGFSHKLNEMELFLREK
ncbi:acetyltransferase [Bacillus manliponensis]|uniref:Acetyltransferase n=1 Tax=Bacillus manliponensis TaxID=574376 RepID=A0A073JUR9_9BACI|nr:GNAT family N-acetyltransferase [Bacillus manliponensis]KEK18045.1 acetyltransferase [Bacillus manliponensis]